MVAHNCFHDRTLQLVFAGKFTAVDDMFTDFRATFDRGEAIMRIRLAFDKIFDEKVRIAQFADVVERAADFGEKFVGANGMRGIVCELADLHAVVVSSFCFVV